VAAVVVAMVVRLFLQSLLCQPPGYLILAAVAVGQLAMLAAEQ
jgi:hypothetical protein